MLNDILNGPLRLVLFLIKRRLLPKRTSLAHTLTLVVTLNSVKRKEMKSNFIR